MFRKTFSLILASIMLLSFVGCTVNEGNSDTSDASNTTEGTTQADETTPVELQSKKINLNSQTEGVKVLGVRNLRSSDVINADWSCSGIEFNALCTGDVKFMVSATANCYYRVYVDGVEYKNGNSPFFTVTTSATEIKVTVANEGIHNFVLMKVTGYTLSRSTIHSVTLTGDITTEAPADKDLYIEFVGDSITCAWGTIGTYDGAYTGQDGTLAFSYLVSQTLEADYSMTALSGQGILCGNPGIPLGYKYACYNKSTTSQYDFERKADAIVINIGTNDFSKSNELGITPASFYTAFRNFVEYAREKNGPDCIFLGVYNMMNDTYGDQIKKVFDDLGGADSNYYTQIMSRQTNTHNTHPSKENNISYAQIISTLLKSILDGTHTPPTQLVSKLPTANSAVVSPTFATATAGSKHNFNISGTDYEVVIGFDAFGTLAGAFSSISAGGTLYLGAGTYSETLSISKDVTIKGPKAGIDPNVRGTSVTDDWTLNPLRGTGEAIFTGQLGMGVMNGTLYADCHNIVIDGIMMSGGVLLRGNTGLEGYGNFTFKNIYVSDVTQTNYVFYFYPYYPASNNPNLYKNNLTMENFRIEGMTKELINPEFESLTVKGLYMSDTCTKALLVSSFYTAASITSGVEYTFDDCMFRNKDTALNLSALTTTNTKNAGIASKAFIKFNVTDCVFANETANPMIKIALDTSNSTVNIENNYFVKVGSSATTISDSACAAADYSTRVIITGNTFTDFTQGSVSLTKSTPAYILTGNNFVS